jgi:hypothetical protein
MLRSAASTRALLGAVLLLGAISIPRRAACEPQEADANRHFTTALSLLDRGEIDAAISEFEAALQVRPHFAVLYNLGQAYGLAGRPVEAADTLRRYLAQGGERIDDQRRAQVVLAVRFYEGLIGTLVVTAPAGSTVALDGATIATDTPVRVRAGRHGVVAFRDGRPLSGKSVDAPSGEVTTINLEPQTAAAGAQSVPAVGWLQVDCDVPDVQVSVDGESPRVAARDAVIPLSSGPHRIAFARADYVTREFSADTQANRLSRIHCSLKPRPDLPAERGAPLRIDVLPSSASLKVDGTFYRGELVPLGRHRVLVQADGFEPWSGEVAVQLQGSRPSWVHLEPTARALHERAARARTLRTWGYVTAGSGAVLGVVASGLFVTQSRAMETWRADRFAFSRDMTQGPATPNELQRAGDLQQRAADIQRTGDVAAALAVTGGALIVASIGLFLGAAATHSHEPRNLGLVRISSMGVSF